MGFPITWAVLAAGCSTVGAFAADLKPEALAAWNRYIGAAEAALRSRLCSSRPFLWMDEDTRRKALARRGELVIEPAAGHGYTPAPGALIHDWLGASFISGVTLDQVLDVVQDYNRYRDIYKPAAVGSRDLGRSNGLRRFAMLWQRKVLWVTASLDAEYESRTYRLDDHRSYSVVSATSIREIVDYGRPEQRELPPDTGSGYIWRMAGIARFDQRDGGVYVEIEAFALTRDIPVSMRWILRPIVARLSRDSLETSLDQTRIAVLKRQKYSSPAVSSGSGRVLAPANIRAQRIP
jgi:hypothetical protein